MHPNEMTSYAQVFEGDCLRHLNDGSINGISLTFVDPPFRQGKDYRFFDDSQPDNKYWAWLKEVLSKIYEVTVEGGAVYFMQREKNAEEVLKVLRETDWKFQNLIIWKKKTSAVPSEFRFSKQHQIIVFATRGSKPRVFNKLRIDLPLAPGQKYERANGVYLSDVWDDIRELTSGYFAGDEAIRMSNGDRFHTQQSPVALLLRIILSSTLPNDVVFDPFAGTGTTLVVAHQLQRNSIGIEIDPKNVEIIKSRLEFLRPADKVLQHLHYYRFTPNLTAIWPLNELLVEQRALFDV